MLRESSFMARLRMAADVVILSVIVITTMLPKTDGRLTTSLFAFLAINIICWVIPARVFGLYGDLRQKPISVEWVMILKTFGIFLLLKGFLYFQVLQDYSFERRRFIVNACFVFLLLPVVKLIIRVVFKRLTASHNYARRVLIVGAGKSGMNFYENFVLRRGHGYELTGFLDDEARPALNGSYLGTTSEIEQIVASYQLDDIVVALPATKEKQIQQIVAVGEREGKRVRIVPDFDWFTSGKMHVDSFGNLSVITLRSLPLDYLDNKIYKRLFDILVSFIGIVFICSWLFPIISILVKLSSKGPVFFRQDRWGLNNETIRCLKFRTMIDGGKDVDENGKYLQAQKNDPRVTRIGRFLRKTNLDELPQLLNVLWGSMSLVGPRPHPVPLNMASKDSIEKYMMRHWVKPGITGWAQVHGYRGETKDNFLMRKRVRYDLWYIEHWSLWLDLQIIVQTFVNMVKGEKNAY